jgi:dihydrolipoamide dehydrogenase
VTIIEQENRLLSNFDREVSQNLALILKKMGVSILTDHTLYGLKKEEEGFLVEYETPIKANGEKSKQVMRIEAIFFATGRKANTAELFGEKYAHLCGNFIPVSEDFQTEIPGVYAIGDVVLNNLQFAHKAMMDAKILSNQLFQERWKKEDVEQKMYVPSCVYIQPEIAMVGLQESEAKAEFEHVKVVKQVMHQLGKQKIVNGERSFLKLLVDKDQMILVGAVLMCEQASELISYLTLAIQEKIPISRLSGIIYPHPTFSEAMGECIDQIQEDSCYGV